MPVVSCPPAGPSGGAPAYGEPRAKRCKLCDESSHTRSEPGGGRWHVQLDRDLFDTISAIYPEWFGGGGPGTAAAGAASSAGGGGAMAEGGGANGGAGGTCAVKDELATTAQTMMRESPPKAIVDTSPIKIDQNKESLKVKLLLRRPFDQLVAQGIMPPHKTPAAYHGQRRQLERAQAGDALKAKIQQRPPRHELERRHILEPGTGLADPSLAERRRRLKRARLADHLNDQLSHRPGPLELIQKNILHTEEPIEQAVKTGRIPYKATSEGALTRPQHPHNYINPEEDSQSSEGGDTTASSPPSSDVLETAAKSAGIVVSLVQPIQDETVFVDLCRNVAAPLLSRNSASSPATSLVSSTSTLSPLSSAASPSASQPPTPASIPPPPPPPLPLTPRSVTSPIAKSDAPGKDKNRKKSKNKSMPKARTIKFHEYKGPPSAQKNSNNNNNSEESSYDLLLKQQTLLLQFQLQLQHKFPQIILPASQKTCPSPDQSNSSSNTTQHSPAPSTSSESSSIPTRISGRLEDMKVSDLKAELKRRNLPVSGSKPQLIERLKPFTNCDSVPLNNPSSVESSVMDHSEAGSPLGSVKEERMEIGEPPSPAPQQQPTEQFNQTSQQDLVSSMSKTNDEIVREQQRQIEELQRELALSQLKLQQQQQQATRTEPKKAQVVALQKHLQARQQQAQQQQQNLVAAMQMRQLQELQARQGRVNEEQQRLQQQQHVAFQNRKNLAGLVLNGTDAALVFNQLMQGKAKVVNGHNRANSLPNFLNGIVTPIIAAQDLKQSIQEDVKPPTEIKIEFAEVSKPPPPLYEEVTKQNKKNSVKSEIVDDVLEILIKNGELPPSAANYPTTPGSANSTKAAEPVYPTVVQNVNNNEELPSTIPNPGSPEDALGIDPNDFLETLDSLDNMDFSQLVMELNENQVEQNDNNNPQTAEEQQVIPMDTDDWLESLINSEHFNGNTRNNVPCQESDIAGYDPLLGVQDPFDPFNLEEFRSPADLTTAINWDKVDYAA